MQYLALVITEGSPAACDNAHEREHLEDLGNRCSSKQYASWEENVSSSKAAYAGLAGPLWWLSTQIACQCDGQVWPRCDPHVLEVHAATSRIMAPLQQFFQAGPKDYILGFLVHVAAWHWQTSYSSVLCGVWTDTWLNWYWAACFPVNIWGVIFRFGRAPRQVILFWEGTLRCSGCWCCYSNACRCGRS